MWQCVKCHERLEENFDVCWSCGTSREGIEDASFRKADDFIPEPAAPEPFDERAIERPPAVSQTKRNPITCLRCHHELEFVGTKAFHEGYNWGVLGDLAELAIHKEQFDVYCCPRCGRMEFFAAGIGAHLRSR